MAERRPLTPATPDTPEAAAYMPRLPWRSILLVALFVGTVATGYTLKERNKADDLRSQILTVHQEQLEPAKKRYRSFRTQLEAMILRASEDNPPATFVDPRLNLAGLRKGQGLYLRLPRQAAADSEATAQAAVTMDADSIPRCLGLSVTSARGLYEQGAFLEDAWLEETEKQDQVMDLRVSDEVLARHIKADLPSVLGLFNSSWFMLVLENGASRAEAPVDVFLWDLKSRNLLLSSRVQARAAMLGARIAVGDGPRAYGKVEEQGGTAADCSIASQLRGLGGGQLVEVSNSALPRDEAVHPDAGVDGGPER